VHVVCRKSWNRISDPATSTGPFGSQWGSHLCGVGGGGGLCSSARCEQHVGHSWPAAQHCGKSRRPRICGLSYRILERRPVYRGTPVGGLSRPNYVRTYNKKPKWAKAPSRFSADTLTRAVKPRCSTNHILEFHPVVVKAPGLRFPNHRRGESHGNRQHAPNA